VAKDLGYELRCAPPGAFDIQYCRSLGYWATRFLLDGGTDAMVAIQAGRLVPIPFHDLMDPKTGKIQVRYVDVDADAYRTQAAYMIRLTREDLESGERRRELAEAGGLSERDFVERFGYVVATTP
jgi:6-phosphofructokinase 1